MRITFFTIIDQNGANINSTGARRTNADNVAHGAGGFGRVNYYRETAIA